MKAQNDDYVFSKHISLSANLIFEDWTSTSPNSFFKEDQLWLTEVEKSIKQNLSNNNYTIRQLANDVSISERQLRRKLKQLLGIKPSKYLKNSRMQHAHHLLAIKQYKTVTQVAYAVGFKDVGAFSSGFKQIFGHSPKKFLKR